MPKRIAPEGGSILLKNSNGEESCIPTFLLPHGTYVGYTECAPHPTMLAEMTPSPRRKRRNSHAKGMMTNISPGASKQAGALLPFRIPIYLLNPDFLFLIPEM